MTDSVTDSVTDAGIDAVTDAVNNERRSPATTPRLHVEGVTLAYDKRTISTDLSVPVPDRAFTAIIGPNACGKSTLLRAMSRLLRPAAGSVVLDGADINSYPAKSVARRLGLLPQSAQAPDGITVADLVARGRFPHQSLLRQWSPADAEAVSSAMAATGVTDLANRLVDELSGGQRQRVWVSMVLAQETDLILLDEPTTYLDIAHQIELLDLLRRLNRDSGRTLVAVLHDLNHAARYADHLIAMKDGSVVATGHPSDILTAELVEHTFGLRCRIIDDPESHTPLVIPRLS
ncbi:iron complex transport system ATP-binding protein [Kineosphaera limosa]|uniref:Putative ABC transporter ATP-binding protein n=1 Tax=Kineosphaera limosa NBRC 100340 TaxID=1184609 RepID=K6WU35_9MICO|nr:ABC transporter ATP-binding protein [Kineosphaera limosa]NYD99667.1 iron complex transport system ATP-binding protein [Kineosphaera limosa]GAB95622.1 putative ABC transporter ATP-binding protein [Kineosphaera limosa NBRC 100340]